MQELVDNMEHDIDAGDDLTTVIKRYNQVVRNTMPVTRAETVDSLSPEDMRKIFAAPKNTPQIINLGGDYIFIETTNIYDDSASLSEADRNFVAKSLYIDNINEMSAALLKDFSKNYKVEINYNRAGINN